MTAKTVSILTNPHPKSHIVFPYGDDLHVAEAVSLFTAAGLSQEESVILIMTDQKRQSVERRLEADGFDVEKLARDGRLTIFHAETLLCQFLESGKPDATRFKRVIEDVISAARHSAPSGKIRLYGEMVNLLCGHNNVEAAAELEELWNETIDRHSVPLLCSYATELLEPHECTGLSQRLMDAHSHVAQYQ